MSDQVIESTFNHPFWVEGQGWTFVKDLQVGDLLVQSDGNKIKINSIEFEQKQVTVYNMTVDDFHTYFVSDLGIWVHNTGKGASCGLPSQGTVSKVDGAPMVDAGKQGKHVPGHPNNVSTKSQWGPGEDGVELTQNTWINGTVVKPDGSVKVWDNGSGTYKAHMDGKGNIHGYPTY